MSRTLFIASFAALLMASAANAAPLQTLTLREQPRSKNQLAAEIVEVSSHRSPASVIAQDGNWGRDLLVGALFGAVDTASMADHKPALRF